MTGLSRSQAIRIAGGVLTIVLILMAGAVSDAGHVGRDQWLRVLFWITVTVTAFCWIVALPRMTRTHLSIWLVVCVGYAGLVLSQGLVHDVGARSIPPLSRVNVATTTAATWRHQNQTFTIYYVFFPLMCLAQYVLLQYMRRALWVRLIAVVMALSSLTLWLPRLLPTLQQLVAPGGRFRGLAVSSNSFGLVAFLVLPWLAAAFLETRRPLARLLYASCAALLLIGVYESGARTAAGSVVVFLVVAPLAVRGRLRARWLPRLTLAVIPLVVGAVIAGVIFIHPHHGSDTVTGRAAQVGQRLEEEGLRGVFFRKEARGLHALVAAVMVRRAPLAGWGPGGFYREFPNAVFLATGRLRPVTDSALNHYLMIAGDLGLPLFVVNLFIITAPLVLGIRLMRKLDDPSELRLVRLLWVSQALFLGAITFMPPSYFPDVLWLWTGTLAYLVVEAERHGLLAMVSRMRSWLAIAGCALLVAVPCTAGAVRVALGPMGYKARQTSDWWPWRYGRDCNEVEAWQQGPGCWCGNDAVLQIPYYGRPPDTVGVRISANHPDLRENPLIVKYGGLGGPTERIVLRSPSWEELRIPAAADYLYSPTASAECARWKLPWIPQSVRALSPREIWYVVLSLGISRTWRSGDDRKRIARRELGVAVLFPGWEPGRGCHPPEHWKEGPGCWCSPDAVLQVSITREPPDSVDVLLGGFHPDIPGNPLRVEYGGWQGATERIVINDLDWHAIRVPVSGDYMYQSNAFRDDAWWHLLSVPRRVNLALKEDQHGFGWFVLSLKASRGWVPQEWGISDDTRSLGVAVLFPKL